MLQLRRLSKLSLEAMRTGLEAGASLRHRLPRLASQRQPRNWKITLGVVSEKEDTFGAKDCRRKLSAMAIRPKQTLCAGRSE